MIKPDEWLKHAEMLVTPRRKGPPAGMDLRRAVSAAYYAVFHKLLGDATDRLVGATNRKKPKYGVVYRAIDHAAIRKRATSLLEPKSKLNKALPLYGLEAFSQEMKTGATAFIDLQAARHQADYDPGYKLNLETAKTKVDVAREAIQNFERAEESEYEFFLFTLLFEPRE